MQKKAILGIVSGIFAFILGLVQRYFEVNNMITPQNSYLLLVGVAILGSTCVGLLIWRFWPNVKQILQIFSNVRRLRLTLKPEQEYKNVGTRFVLKVSEEERELLDFYRQQKANWKGNIRLKIVRVTQDIAGDVPKVIFWLEMINYLPVKFKLIKVTHSSGTVSAGEFGSCLLPSLPETIDKTINPCSENEFKLEMPVHGTRVPNFLSNVSVAGQLLQWMLKGEWYIEIYSKLEVWQYQSYQITYNQIIATSEVVKRRERE